MAEKNIPAMRFKGFVGEWFKKPFSEAFSNISNNTLSRTELNYSSGLAKNVHYGDVLIKFGELLDAEKEEIPFISNDALANKYKLSKLQDGDVVIADAAEDETVGKCTEIMNVGNQIITSGLHTIPVRPELVFASKYLGYYMNSNAFHNQLLRLMQGTKVLSISKTAIKDTSVVFPEETGEQTQIGSYFQSLDKLINLHQAKLNKLTNLKKAMLEKMFPKDGADVPEIRFKGFDGTWELKDVSALLTERNVQAPKSNEYPLMAFIAYDGVAPKGDRYNREFLVNDEENKKYKQTELGDFIYSSNNLETGSIGLNNYGSASISPVYSIFQPTEIGDSDFIGRLMLRKSFINQMVRWRQGVVYGQWRIHESDFLKIEVCFPKLSEQRKIGKYFKSLDLLINLHQTELKKLNNLKKACLKKMFV
jgi:type I restriction enzyme S subunit